MKKKVFILGAGISGLYAGLRLLETGKFDIALLEKTKSVGGMAKSFRHNGFTLDFGPHKIYSVIPGVIEEYWRIMDDDLINIKKKNSIFLEGKKIEFPLNIFKIHSQIKLKTIFFCGLSFLNAQLKKIVFPKKINTYEDYFINGFGKTAYELIFRDLAIKVWGDPRNLSEELARKRVPVPNALNLIMSIFKRNKPTMSADSFLYPRCGFGSITETLANKILKKKGKIFFESIPDKLEIQKKGLKYRVQDKFFTEKNIDIIISTIHLTDFLSILKPAPPKEILEAAQNLKFRGLVLVYLFFNKESILKDHWIFFPEKKYIFNRVSEPKKSSSNVAPEGKTYIIAEITLDSTDSLFEEDARIVERVIKDLELIGLINKEDIFDTLVKKARRVYPVYDINYKKNLNVLLEWIDKAEYIYSIGRLGLFNYNNTDHCIDTGIKLSNHIISNERISDWKKIRKNFESYTIID